ncbi:hypothetical protein [Arthrobacter sp. ZGTC412]|nr:hypothetical protein [Arthrobacter sp. ZGTC412]
MGRQLKLNLFIYPGGTTLNQADAGYRPPSLTDPLLRRRSR